MAFIKPDYKLKKSEEVIKNLDNSEDNELIRYYILKQQKTIEEQNIKLKEYREFFNMFNKLTPNRSSTIYK
jgi:hypothetical protein